MNQELFSENQGAGNEVRVKITLNASISRYKQSQSHDPSLPTLSREQHALVLAVLDMNPEDLEGILKRQEALFQIVNAVL